MRRARRGDSVITIDGTKYSDTGQDYQATSGTVADVMRVENDSGSGATIYTTELDIFSGVTADTDVADGSWVYGYHPAGTPTTEFDNTDVDTYTAGDVGDRPWDTSGAVYSSNPTGTSKWAVEFDSTGGGPLQASDTGVPHVCTYWYYTSRGGGSGSGNVKELLAGHSNTAVAAMEGAAYSPATGNDAHSITISDDPRAAGISGLSMPSAGQNGKAGMAHDGARDHEFWDVYLCWSVGRNMAAGSVADLNDARFAQHWHGSQGPFRI